MMDLDKAICAYYDREYSYDGVIVVDSDGQDIVLSLALRGQAGAVERRRLSGMGRDPRIELLANRIWEDVRDQTIDLHYENERQILEKAAIDFIESGKSELDGSVHLSDGDSYNYYLNRKDANKMQTERGIKLETELGNLLESFNLQDRSNSVMVFAGRTVGNEYLMQTLGKGFRTVEQLTGALEEAVKSIGDALPENTEEQHLQPQQQPVQSAQQTQPQAHTEPQPQPQPQTHTEPQPQPETQGEPQLQPRLTPKPQPAPQPEPQPAQPQPATPQPQPATPQNVTASIPVIKINAKVLTEKAGLFKKKRILDIEVDSADIKKLKWKSVLVIQEKPLTTLIEENVVKEFSRGDELPFYLKFDLPLRHCPDASKLRIYLKPDPDEPVGINEAYNQYPVTVSIS